MLIKVNNKFPTIGDNTYIAPTSSVIGDVILNTYSSIWFGAVVRADNGSIKIGERTNIQDNSVIHADDNSYIGNNVTIGHGVTCHAKTIMDNCLLGNGSTLNEGVIVGEFSLIASGSMVLENMKIPPKSLVMGNPARIRGEVNERHVELIKLSCSTYVDKVKIYLESENFT
ncbi:MAG: gamma carbonic anhydrase family protein [Chloroflexi bacterium]|nr:gamma carbonic anhydrase family protein [Chloroflexota bacterium]MBK66332.1 gamma carbonic anhydrase family protein [Chloroflexota bacterium]|tara:strand:+ start:188 stop:700 length:513 start_codon:yes stop_codon:yes gene_type:complete